MANGINPYALQQATGAGPFTNQMANQQIPAFPPPRQAPAPRQGMGGRMMGILGSIGDFIGNNPELMNRLAIGFQGMTLNPNQALINANQRQLELAQAQRLAQGQAGRTAAWLRTQPGGESYAQLIEQNPTMKASDILAMYTASMDALKPTETIRTRQTEAAALGFEPGSQQYRDYVAFGEGTRLSTTDRIAQEGALRDDLRTDLNQLGFNDIRSGFNTVKEFVSRPSGVSDYALTIAFLKILDPGSVVREGEVAALNRTTALAGTLKAQMRNVLTGDGVLAESTRRTIADLAQARYAAAAQEATAIEQQYKQAAKNMGLNYENIGLNVQIPEAKIELPEVKSVPPVPPKTQELEQALQSLRNPMTYEEFKQMWPNANESIWSQWSSN